MRLPRPLRVGLLGYGWVNRKIWDTRLAWHPATQVVARFDPAGTADSYASIEEFWSTSMDVVIVGTPNHTHGGLARQAARRGCSVVVEKPSCLTTAEYDAVAEQMAPGTVFLTAMPAAFRSDVRQLADSIGPGPFDIEASWRRRDGVPGIDSWFTDRQRAGGGALLDLGWHLADAAYVMLTAPLTSVKCELTPMSSDLSRTAQWRSDTNTTTSSSARDVEVAGTLTARYADGSILRLSAAWSADVGYDSTHIQVRTQQRSAHLWTTFGFSPHREPAPRLIVTDRAGSTTFRFLDAIGTEYDDQVDAIVAAIQYARQDPKAKSDWTDKAKRIMDLMEQAYRTAEAPLQP